MRRRIERKSEGQKENCSEKKESAERKQSTKDKEKKTKTRIGKSLK